MLPTKKRGEKEEGFLKDFLHLKSIQLLKVGEVLRLLKREPTMRKKSKKD
jgi:hypothetical protein